MTSRSSILNRTAGVGRALVLAAALLALVAYVVVALSRLGHPFELEWMEGGVVAVVQRILDGQRMYVEPSIDYVPFIYTPLYFEVSAWAARLFGTSFVALRIVSFVASLGSMAIIFRLIRSRTTSVQAGLIGAGLFAATYGLSGAWFDLARVDSLFLFLTLSAIVAFDSPRIVLRSLLAPALLFLAFFTKQTAAIIAVAMVIAAVLTLKGRERVAFGLVFGGLVGLSTILLNWSSEGWYRYFVFDLPFKHGVVESTVLGFWKNDLALSFAIALSVSLFALTAGSGHATPGRRLRDALIFGSLLIASWSSRMHSGGYENVLMPMHAAIALSFGVGLAGIRQWVAQRPLQGIALSILVLGQFWLLAYAPMSLIPTAQDRQRGKQILNLVSEFEGEVYVAAHPWFTGAVGKSTQAQEMTVRDITRARGTDEREQMLRDELAAAVVAERFEAFLVDEAEFFMRPPGFEEHYKLIRSDLSGDELLLPTGWDRRPGLLYIRRRADAEAMPGP
jgi:hypothetical protein